MSVSRTVIVAGAGAIGRTVAYGLARAGHTVTVIDDLSSGDRRRVAEEARLVELDIVDRAGVAAIGYSCTGADVPDQRDASLAR